MSLTFQIEPVSQCWNEIMVLAHQHWAGTRGYRRHEPFNPSFERYHACNQSGFFQLFTARDGQKLVAYFGTYLSPSMHSQLLMATEDTMFIEQDYRGGRNALRFLKYVLAQFRAWNVYEVMFSCEIDNETGIKGILLYLDFEPAVVQYRLRLIPPPHADSVTTSSEESHVGTEI